MMTKRVLKGILPCLFFMVLSVIFVPSIFAQEKMRIAVLDLRADDVPEKTARTISNMLRNELVNDGHFLVVERGQMDAILDEQGFQQTGCTDQSCAVEMGRLLSVKKMLIGDVSESNGTLYVTVRVVDVEKGVVEYAEKEVADSDERLDKITSNLAKKLVSRILGEGRSDVAGEVRIPSGITASWMMFTPLDDDFSTYYDTMQGGSVGYIYPVNDYIAAAGKIAFNYSDGLESDTTAYFNSYYAGAHLGYPVLEFVYPYINVSIKGIWLSEKSDADSNNFFGYGACAGAGVAFMFTQSMGVFGEYSYEWGKVMDDNGTAVSGTAISAGLIYKL